MDFFKKSGFPAPNSGIELECLQQEEGKFSLFIKDDEQRVIGCGIYEPLIENDWFSIAPKIANAEGHRDFEESNCFFFILADEFYYLVDTNMINPTPIKERSLDALTKRIGTVKKSNQEYGLNQIKNQAAELSDKISEYETSLREKESLIESLTANLERYRKDADNLKTEKNKLEKLLKCEYSRNVITIVELGKRYNKLQMERLLRKPFYFDETKIIRQRLGMNFVNRKEIALTEMSWKQNHDGSSIKLRVKYDFWEFEEGEYFPNNKTHCFFIDELGEIEREEYWEQEDDKYVLVDMTNTESENDWISHKEVDYSKGGYIKEIHLDTRDFSCYAPIEEDTDEYSFSDFHLLLKIKELTPDYFYTTEEVKNLIEDLYQRSGGENEYRYLSFKGKITCGWELKYLRFYKTEKGFVCLCKEKRFKDKWYWTNEIDLDLLQTNKPEKK